MILFSILGSSKFQKFFCYNKSASLKLVLPSAIWKIKSVLFSMAALEVFEDSCHVFLVYIVFSAVSMKDPCVWQKPWYQPLSAEYTGAF